MSSDLVTINPASIEQASPAMAAEMVTAALVECRSWLTKAMEGTDPTPIAEFKAWAATVEEATKQKNLGREIELDAAEMVRRAKRGIGVERDGSFYIIDGQHRKETLVRLGWGDQQVQCWTYVGLTDEEMAERFLQFNDTLTVNTFTKFRVGVNAGRKVEQDIDRVVRAAGLCISTDKVPGAISAVGTLRKVYDRAGPGVLSRSLGLIRDAYGDAGMQAAVIDGVGLLCQRYNGELDVPIAVERLSKAHAGVSGLLQSAERLRQSTGNQKGHCVAAAAVDIINRGRGGKKLPSWWRESA